MNLCRSIETFLKVTFGKPAKELSNDLQNRRAAAEAAGTSVAWWPSVGDIKPSPELIGALKTYSAVLGLPEYNEAIERQSGGRPTAFWSDAVAFAMAEYLREQTKSPKWSAISNLLKCAPQIPQISMDRAKIRQRLVRWKREEKAQQRFKPTLRESAYEVKRLFDKWDRESPCPSLLVASEFRNPAGDTSISQINSKLIDDIANKYPT